MIRLAICVAALVALASCTAPSGPVTDQKRDLGDFVLGHNIVVAPQFQKGPLSREASKDAFIASMKNAIDSRFGRYDGDRVVHFGINISGYVLAQNGVPLVLSPKSALIITVTAWDDRAGGKFNEEAREFVVLESFTTFGVSSGMTMTAEEQMDNLTFNAAKQIETWIYDNRACLADDVPAEVLAECWKDTSQERAERKKQLDELR
ncbi:hypothetical protein shim_31780 [Shimia sp. SK013]|uniref:hypothetical protein n=1 Tax=Shimia sp. SK013 TaxID=1389006 RepID=UPI0006B5C426|nr:hypothetical protein [Shimia sp. SK013]KPA20575.1 hypothetical protein shim_31780 [Shimia sp. SK013]